MSITTASGCTSRTAWRPLAAGPTTPRSEHPQAITHDGMIIGENQHGRKVLISPMSVRYRIGIPMNEARIANLLPPMDRPGFFGQPAARVVRTTSKPSIRGHPKYQSLLELAEAGNVPVRWIMPHQGVPRLRERTCRWSGRLSARSA